MRTTARTLLAASIGMIMATGTTQVMAQGFALYEPDVATMGTAYAGAGASTENATVVASNPAAMSRLDKINVSAGNTLILAKSDIKDPAGTAPGTNKGDMVPRILTGDAFMTIPHVFLDNLAVGLGIYAPFGLKTNYENTFQGRTFGDKSTVIVTSLQPSISYNFTPTFSLGAGINFNHIEGVLTNGVVPGDLTTTQELKGSDNAIGYTVGALLTPIPEVNLGLTYHSKVDYTLHGSAQLQNVPVTGVPGVTFNAGTPANLDLTTPDSLELAGVFKVAPTLDLKASVTRTRWSSIKQLSPMTQFTANGITTSPVLTGALGAQVNAGILNTLNSSSSGEVLNLQDSNMYSIGADWQAAEKLKLRLGFGYDESPVRKEYRNVRLPVANRTIYAVGANYAFTKNLDMDIAYNYLREANANINRASATQGVYQANYQNSGHLIGAQLNYRWW